MKPYGAADLALNRTGPKPRCRCGDCVACRQRGARNRRNHGLPPLNQAGGSRRTARLALPTELTMLAYIAGILDGEGCISLSQKGAWTVQVGMVDQPLIEFLGTIGGTVRREDRTAKGCQLLYRWRLLAAEDVRGFLVAVLPYLRVKRARADECLLALGQPQLYESPPCQQHTASGVRA